MEKRRNSASLANSWQKTGGKEEQVGVLDSAGRNNAVLSQFISYFSRG